MSNKDRNIRNFVHAVHLIKKFTSYIFLKILTLWNVKTDVLCIAGPEFNFSVLVRISLSRPLIFLFHQFHCLMFDLFKDKTCNRGLNLTFNVEHKSLYNE